MAEWVRVESPAKVNLHLGVRRALRADGYHEVATVFQAIELCDFVELSRQGDTVTVECDVPGVPLDGSNLAVRAVEALREDAGSQVSVHVRLRKQIPPMGGLGGGSSNAAAALVGAAHLLDLWAEPGRLERIASRLGADVAFFIRGGMQVGRGHGEALMAVSSPHRPWVVVVKGPGCASTARVYAEFDREGEESPMSVAEVVGRFTSGDFSGLFNSLAAPAIRLVPEIGDGVAALRAAGAAGATVAGSGACAFGVFTERGAADAAARSLSGRFEFVRACALREDGVRVVGAE